MLEEKIKVKELMKIQDSLMYLSQLGTGAWYAVSKNIIILKPFIEGWESDRKEIVEKLGKRDSDNKLVYDGENENRTIVWDEGEKEEADKIWEETMNSEINIPEFLKIPVEKLIGTTINPETKKEEDIKIQAFIIEPLLGYVLVD